MEQIDCPSHEQLRDFLAGRLPDWLIERISLHIEQCDACSDSMDEIEANASPRIAAMESSSPIMMDAVDEFEALVKRVLSAGEQSRSETIVDSSAESAVEPIRAGEVFGQYRLIRRLGQGSFGLVYQARHEALRRDVVLKLLRWDSLHLIDARRRFEKEMEAVGQLDHANLVKATDAGEFDGIPYLAMEFHPGRTLAAVLREHPFLPATEACSIALQIAKGLSHAHGKGLIHRDIKPSNVLVGDDGIVKILDLGLALFDPQVSGAPAESRPNASPQQEPSRVTQPGTAVGTRTYMAPEQWVDSRRVDHRADIYSLGCLLHRLLTGQHAGQSSTPIMPLSKESRQVNRLSSDDPLTSVLSKMRALDPTKRYASAAEVIEALAPFADQTSSIKPIESVSPASSPDKEAFDGSPPRPIRFSKANQGSRRPLESWSEPGSSKSGKPVSISPSSPRRFGSLRWMGLLLMLVTLIATSAVSVFAIAAWLDIDRDQQTTETDDQSSISDSDSESDSASGTSDAEDLSGSPDTGDTADGEDANSSDGGEPSGDVASAVPNALRLTWGSSLRILNSRAIVHRDEPITIEFWIRATGHGMDQTILSTSYSDARNHLRPFDSAPGWRLDLRSLGIHDQLMYFEALDSLSARTMGMIPSGQAFCDPWGSGWHHVAVVRDHSNCVVFVDGAEIMRVFGGLPTMHLFGSRRESGNDLVLGSHDQFVPTPGRTLEVRAFRISTGARYAGREFVPPLMFEDDEDTLCLLDFATGEGDTLSDLSGEGRAGRAVNAVWIPQQ